jgi:serine/threonine-protein kinase HipA
MRPVPARQGRFVTLESGEVARPKALDVWMNGELVGTWGIGRSATSTFLYADSWLRSDRVRPISLSIPLTPGNEPQRGPHIDDWFDNLLPDSPAIRTRVSRRFRVQNSTADLLAAVGRDCVGAAQIVEAGDAPPSVAGIQGEPLNGAGIARLLRNVTSTGELGGQVAGEDDVRLSIAGAQEKTALLHHAGRWQRPLGATPSTHLLKLPLGLIGNLRMDMRNSVENEWLCMHLLAAFGLPVAGTQIASFSDEVSTETVLVVKRFDRHVTPPTPTEPEWLVRLPQEDFCQATATPNSEKYESHGGPGIARCLELLRGGANADGDALTFAKAQLAFWLLAAIDGHAKNFSIFLRRDRYVMTPLYDVLSAWPVIGHGSGLLPIQKAELAMGFRGRKIRRHINRISARHWRWLADLTGVPGAFESLTLFVESAQAGVRTVEGMLPAGFPEQVWTTVSMGVLAQRQRFLNALVHEEDVDED